MSTRLGAGWIHPTSIETRFFANREKEKFQLKDILDDLLRNKNRSHRIAIYGDRGIGKSILTSNVLWDFANEHADRVVPVVVNARGIAFRQSLKTLASELVKNTKPKLARLRDKGPMLQRWLDELALLAHNDQITEEQVEEVASEYGVGAKVAGGLLMVLQGESTLSWQQTRTQSTGRSRVQIVTDDLVHAALTATLKKIHDETDLMVAVFFDDLDQAHTNDVSAMKPALKRILDVHPCVGLVHVRTEMLFDDLRREMDDSIEVGAMDTHGLMAMLLKRLEYALEEDKLGFSRQNVKSATQKLVAVTGNPLALLRWVQAFIRTKRWPPDSPTSWCEDAALIEVAARAATAAGIEDELLHRVAVIVDRCLSADGVKALKDDICRGHVVHRPDDGADKKCITEDEFALFVRAGLLVPRDNFRIEAGYRLDPMLDLLRPSVAARLRGS